MKYGSRLNHDVRFFLDSYELSGIESVSIDSQAPYQVVSILGGLDGLTLPAGPREGNISFSRYLLYDDPILSYTGTGVMNGSIHYSGAAMYGFEKAYLNSYSVSCAIGSLPKVTASMVTYQAMYEGNNQSGNAAHPTIDIPTQGSISITCDGSTTNRVIGFDYSINMNRVVNHHEITPSSTEAVLVPPIVFNAQVQYDVDDLFMEDSHTGFLTSTGTIDQENLVISINGRGGGTVQSLTIPNATLVGEQLTKSNNGSLRLVRNYVGRLGLNPPEPPLWDIGAHQS